MVPRHRAILELAARHRFILRRTVATVFGVPHPENVLKKLSRAGHIHSTRDLPNLMARYAITEEACRALSLPRTASQPIAGADVSKYLAQLWFCTMDGVRRTPLYPDELSRLLSPTSPSQALHVVERRGEEGDYRVLGLYCPNPTTSVKAICERLARRLSAAAADSAALARLIKSDQYGFAVLVPTVEKKHAVEKALLATRASCVSTHAAPHVGTLSRFLRAK